MHVDTAIDLSHTSELKELSARPQKPFNLKNANVKENISAENC